MSAQRSNAVHNERKRMTEQKRPETKELEKRIGYTFRDRYLLECALTHTSYANEQKIRRYQDYERLEFLGDAVLEMVSSEFLYGKYPGKGEGELTKIRASLVCEPALAFCAKDLELPRFIRLGRGEESGGGREKASIISDVMEAIIGAMYLDSRDVTAPRAFIMQFILSDLEGKLLFYDAKSILQERCQKFGRKLSYELVSEEGPCHDRIYRVNACIDGQVKSEGSGRSKKAAEQNAAYEVLLALQETKDNECI